MKPARAYVAAAGVLLLLTGVACSGDDDPGDPPSGSPVPSGEWSAPGLLDADGTEIEVPDPDHFRAEP